MSKATPPIPAGHEGLIPHLVCDPCADAIEFYKRAFGAEEVGRVPAPDRRRIMHAAIRIGGRFVFLVDDFPEFSGGRASSPKALNGTPVTAARWPRSAMNSFGNLDCYWSFATAVRKRSRSAGRR